MRKYLLTLIILFTITKPMVFNKQTVPKYLKEFENSIPFKIYNRLNEIFPYKTILMKEIEKDSFSYGYGLTIERFQPLMIINVKF